MERFQLLNGDVLVASFMHSRTLLGDVYSDIVVRKLDLLPIRLKSSCADTDIHNWITLRSIPENRRHRDAMLQALNIKVPFDLMSYSHALSLNDTFWIKKEDEDITFASINLYDNKIDEGLGYIAFTGLLYNINADLSTPELTTAGMLPKFWQRNKNDDIILCKGNTGGYTGIGYEPYREVAAHIIAGKLGVATIPYYLDERHNKVVSISKLFTSKQIGLITGSEYLDQKFPSVKTKHIKELLSAMKDDKINPCGFYEMCFLDYITENYDRHLNNWGFSVDNRTQQIIGFALLLSGIMECRLTMTSL